MKPKKIRLDQLLVQKEMVESRSQARALILAGNVLVHNTVTDKAGALFFEDAPVSLKTRPRYVSRGGLKLEKALDEFKTAVRDRICLDIGASTGGFTDCLLQRGAQKVFAVDVGYGQLHWKLQKEPRVVRLDRLNFRHIDFSKITSIVTLAVMDVSFISVKKLFPVIRNLFLFQETAETRDLIVLVKPQFEVGRNKIGKGGIVRDSDAREEALANIVLALDDLGFEKIQTTTSPITGADGNVEFLVGASFNTGRVKKSPSVK